MALLDHIFCLLTHTTKLVPTFSFNINNRLEQFNDVLLQENGLGLIVQLPSFNLTALNAAKRNVFACQEVVKVSLRIPTFFLLVISSFFIFFLGVVYYT